MKPLFKETKTPYKLYIKLEDGTFKELKPHVCAHCNHIANTEELAKKCCQQWYCTQCGCETYQYHLLCTDCRDKNRMDKAIEIPLEEYKNDAVYAPDEFYEDMDYLLDDDSREDAYVYAVKVNKLSKENPERIVDHLLENLLDSYQDEEGDGFEGTGELKEMVKHWLSKQTSEYWEPDYSHKLKVPRNESES